MANLLGQNIGTNYKGILNLGSTINTPVSGTLQAITDGDGLASALNVSTTSVAVSGTLGVTAGANLAIASGDVGIGTSSPTTKLTVNGVIRLFDGSLTGTGGVELSSEAGFGFAAQSVAYKFRNQNNNATYVILDSDGLKFKGDTAAANALDDYEEGTWTPTDGSGAALSFTLNGTAIYTKIGRVVTLRLDVTYPSTVDASNMNISGLPFVCVSDYGASIGFTDLVPAASTFCQLSGNTQGFRLQNTGGTTLTNATMSTKRVQLSATYFV